MSAKKSSWFSLSFGMISLMLCWFFWVPVYGVALTILTFILAVMAIIFGRKLKKQSANSLDMVDTEYLRNAKIGRVLGYSGVFFSIICFIFAILFTVYFKYLIQ
jgi:hypothetical protein